jgi:hypothetical protein
LDGERRRLSSPDDKLPDVVVAVVGFAQACICCKIEREGIARLKLPFTHDDIVRGYPSRVNKVGLEKAFLLFLPRSCVRIKLAGAFQRCLQGIRRGVWMFHSLRIWSMHRLLKISAPDLLRQPG